jgi:hypothetical protein
VVEILTKSEGEKSRRKVVNFTVEFFRESNVSNIEMNVG